MEEENVNARDEAAKDPTPKADKGTRRRRRRAWLRYTLAGLIMLLAASAALVVWEASSLLDDFREGEKGKVVANAKPELGKQPARPLEQELGLQELGPPRTILLIGSDQRPNEAARGRADALALLRIDPERKSVAVLSIPRDLKVKIPGYGTQKVNAAYAIGGPRLQIATIREYFGIRVDHFVETAFQGFGDLVATLDGVYLPVDQRYLNSGANGYAPIDLHAGYQRLNRQQALDFVRYRHGDSDIYRIARQHLFLREVAHQVVAAKYDLGKMRPLVHAFARATTSDLADIGEVWKLVNVLRVTPPERVVRVTLDVHDVITDSYYLDAAPPKRRAAIKRWYEGAGPAPKETTAPQEEDKRPRLARLEPDQGRGRALLAALEPAFQTCTPTRLPTGYSWGSREPARKYKLAGQPALAMYATAQSGRSALWMMTTWNDVPVLSAPTRVLELKGRAYELWVDSGRLRQLAWRVGETRVWLTNTLRNELTNAEMLALAASCR